MFNSTSLFNDSFRLTGMNFSGATSDLKVTTESEMTDICPLTEIIHKSKNYVKSTFLKIFDFYGDFFINLQ